MQAKSDELNAQPGLQQSALVGKGSKIYYQTGHAFASGNGIRSDTITVNFPVALNFTPIVHVSLVGIDSANSANLRINLDVQNVTSNGFEVVASTWFDTLIYAIHFSWLAINPNR